MDLKYRLAFFIFWLLFLILYVVSRYIFFGMKPSKKRIEDANKYFEKSVECENREEIKEGIDFLNKALEICENKYEYYLFRAKLFFRLNPPDFEKALDDINKAMTLKIDDIELYQIRLFIYKKLGYHDLAYNDAKYLIHLSPTIKNYVECANLALLMGEADKTLLNLLSALNIAKKNGDKRLTYLIEEKINKLK